MTDKQIIIYGTLFLIGYFAGFLSAILKSTTK